MVARILCRHFHLWETEYQLYPIHILTTIKGEVHPKLKVSMFYALYHKIINTFSQNNMSVQIVWETQKWC